MNSYSTYKDSGIDWLEKIPVGWSRSRIRMIGDLYGGLTGKKGNDFNNEGNPFNKPFIPFTNIFNNTYISKEHFQIVNVNDDERQNRVLKNDLFFLMSSESYEDLGKSSILLEEVGELYLNSFCKGFRITDKKVNPLFLNYQLLGSLHKEMISIEGNGFTRINLRQDRLLDTPVFIPPLTEQQQIVNFLDDKTAKIDQLIAFKEKKIELLEEKRTALINQAVTKGLNPDVEYKDSGVEWIGDIPEHWKTSKLGFYTTKIGSGSTPRGGAEVYVNEGIPFVRSQNVHFDGLQLDNVSFIENDVHSSMKGSTVYKEDVLLNITGGSIGRCCVVDLDQEMNVNQHVSIIRTTKGLLNYFLNYIISSDIGQSQVRFNLTGGNREGLTIEGIRDFRVTIPNLEEQQKIVNYLDEQTQEIDDLVQLEQQKIDLLKEYRQSLISEVVTGKVRVCEEDDSQPNLGEFKPILNVDLLPDKISNPNYSYWYANISGKKVKWTKGEEFFECRSENNRILKASLKQLEKLISTPEQLKSIGEWLSEPYKYLYTWALVEDNKFCYCKVYTEGKDIVISFYQLWYGGDYGKHEYEYVFPTQGGKEFRMGGYNSNKMKFQFYICNTEPR